MARLAQEAKAMFAFMLTIMLLAITAGCGGTASGPAPTSTAGEAPMPTLAEEEYEKVDSSELPIDSQASMAGAVRWDADGNVTEFGGGKVTRLALRGKSIELVTDDMLLEGKEVFIATKDYGKIKVTFGSGFGVNLWLKPSQKAKLQEIGTASLSSRPAASASAAASPSSKPEAATKPQKTYSAPPAVTIDPKKDYTATLRTNMGDIKIKLFAGEVPQTVNNFVFLARDGYYDGVRFHRVIKGFIIQSGDPTGTGTGTPGYRFKDEPITRDYEAGTLAMANAGPNTNGAQFFITHADMSGGKLPKNYTIFGKVMDQASMGVVDKIAAVPVQAIRGGELSSPMVDVHIDSVSIEELPALGTAVRVPPTATPVPPAVTPKPTYGPATPSAGAGTVIDEIGWVEVMFSGTVDLGQKTPTNLGQTLIFHGRKANYAIELLPEVKLQVPAEDKEAGGVAFRSGDSHQYLIKGSLSGNKSQGSIFVAGLPIVEVAYLERVK